MLSVKGHTISAISFIENGIERTISIISNGAEVVWQAVNSCFGSGVWRKDKPWKNSDKWKNFK